jgi:hypothetical protein
VAPEQETKHRQARHCLHDVGDADERRREPRTARRKIASGTPIATAIEVEIATSRMCSATSVATSC